MNDDLRLTEKEALLLVWLYENAGMPRVTTALNFADLLPIIRRLKRRRG